jgi:hypothetical protein
MTPGNVAPAIQELMARDRWVVWRYVERDGKATKPPFNAETGELAKSDDPTTWRPYAAAAAAAPDFDGVGFLPAGEYTGVDLDHCLDPETLTRAPAVRSAASAAASCVGPSRSPVGSQKAGSRSTPWMSGRSGPRSGSMGPSSSRCHRRSARGRRRPPSQASGLGSARTSSGSGRARTRASWRTSSLIGLLRADAVLAEIRAVAFARLTRVASWGPDGVVLIPSDQLEDDDVAAVAEVIDHTRRRVVMADAPAPRPDGAEPAGPQVAIEDRQIRLKLFDKVEALRLAAKALGLLKDRVELEAPSLFPPGYFAAIVTGQLDKLPPAFRSMPPDGERTGGPEPRG